MNSVQTTPQGEHSDTRKRKDRANGNPLVSNGPTALVVDDDPGMLKLAAAMLKQLGYDVTMAREGAEALFDFSRTPCDLALIDYIMPAINGYQLGRVIKSRHPTTRVVIMTGVCRAAVTGLMSDDDIDGWLFKPYGVKELKILLERVGLPGSAAGD